MKLLILLLFPFCLSAQVASLSYQPLDNGLGIKYDQYFGKAGVYISATKGNYKLPDRFINSHYKLSSGVNIKTVNGYLGVGYCLHKFGATEGEFNSAAFEPVSFEYSVGVVLDRVIVGVRNDFIRHELTVDIGFLLWHTQAGTKNR